MQRCDCQILRLQACEVLAQVVMLLSNEEGMHLPLNIAGLDRSCSHHSDQRMRRRRLGLLLVDDVLQN